MVEDPHTLGDPDSSIRNNELNLVGCLVRRCLDEPTYVGLRVRDYII